MNKYIIACSFLCNGCVNETTTCVECAGSFVKSGKKCISHKECLSKGYEDQGNCYGFSFLFFSFLFFFFSIKKKKMNRM